MLVVVGLSWLSGRALAAQARGVLGSTPGGCRPFSLSSIFASKHLISSLRQDALGTENDGTVKHLLRDTSLIRTKFGPRECVD